MRRTRGLIDLLFDLVDETTDLVERTHGEVVERWAQRLDPIEPVRSSARAIAHIQQSIAGGVCYSIRTINGITTRHHIVAGHITW